MKPLPGLAAAALRGLSLSFLFFLAPALVGCGGFSFEVKIPKSLIIDQVKHKFPTVRSKGLMTVKLANPQLDFEGSRNRLGVVADAEVRLLGMIPLPGKVDCDGTLEYRPKHGAFVFTDVKVKKFTIQGLSESRADEVSGIIGSAVLGALGGLEVYRLNPKATEEKLAKLALRSIRVTNDGVVAKLGLGGK
ncbi:MAG: DUF1439 domain-containing protein [Candidatus Methylacidiphilales bacterium]|nr:DUF1439 domain-containing protein [Candidatus Methylacidiphilales bacterium]